MHPGLKDRVVVITGAAGNLGAACGTVFAEAGARCALLDRAPSFTAAPAAKDALALGGIDFLDAGAVARAAEAVAAKLGRIDALVHTVGGYAGGQLTTVADDAEWDRMLALNLRTSVNAIRAFVPPMAAQKFGRVVAIGARGALGAPPRHAAYAASKAALLRTIEALAAELRDSGVTANTVLLSTLDTPQNRAAMPNADFAKWLPPEQVARTIAFLCSDAGGEVSGAAIPIYGRS
jgi:NAD(P)-dependent dehydrogenase (short-subunit alcohol dehydrogenase family)